MKRYLPKTLKSSAIRCFVLAGLTLTGTATTAMADWTISSFDTDLASNGGAENNTFHVGDTPQPSQLVWTNVNAPGGAGGSMYIVINWNGGGGWQDTKVQTDMAPWPGYDLRQYQYVEFDVMILTNLSQVDASGNYGSVQIVCQGWDGAGDNSGVGGYNGLANVTLVPTNGWQHVKASTLGFPHFLNRLTLNFNVNPNQANPTQIHYLVDNVVLTSPPLEPPTLGELIPAPSPGLALTPTSGSQWQRVMVYPNPADTNNLTGMVNEFGWYGRATPSTPVSYAFSISDFPAVPGYAANVYWIPNAHMQWGQGDTAGDWNSTNTMVFSIEANTDNPPTAWNVTLSCKTNLGGGNPNFPLIGFARGQLPNGKWTISFTSDTDFSIQAPDGWSTNASLPADVADLVSGNSTANLQLTPYFGIMPRTPENIGLSCTFGRIQISGVPYPVDDTFGSGVFDTNKWRKLADSPTGIYVSSSDLLHFVTWNTPNDQGFTSLVAAADPAGPWKEIGLPSSQWILAGNVRQAAVSKAALHAALGGSETNAAYYRLIKREFVKLQVLLPGEQAAPGTPTGKTGTPTPQQIGVPFDVVVRAVDADWYPVNSTDMVHLTSTDPAMGLPPFDTPMVGGVATISGTVYFNTAGNWTITAADATDIAKTSNTSSPVTANP